MTRDQMLNLRAALGRARRRIVARHGDEQAGLFHEIYDVDMDVLDEWERRGLLDVPEL